MPQPTVLVQHDDDRTYVATVLAQYRLDGRWRALVRYSTAPGMQFQQARWADELRPVATSQLDGAGAADR